MKKRPLRWVGLGLLAAAPFTYYLSVRLQGQHFYRLRPTSYWGREVARWAKDEERWTAPWPERLAAGVRNHRR
jgi:hypothetical protein